MVIYGNVAHYGSGGGTLFFTNGDKPFGPQWSRFLVHGEPKVGVNIDELMPKDRFIPGSLSVPKVIGALTVDQAGVPVVFEEAPW